MKLKVRKFDPSTMKPGRITVLIGARGRGKSVCLRDLMFHQKDKVDFGIAMTPTEESIQHFRKCMPDSWIYRQYQHDKIEDLINVQRKTLKSGKTPKHIFLVLDDCMYDKKILKTQAMRDVFMNGRHLKISLFIAAQYLMDLGPDLRTQIDYVVSAREFIITNKAKLWKYFYGMFDKFDDFTRVMDKCTENFGVIIMDNTATTSNLEDCVFWYRADVNLPEYRMGKDIYWKLSEQFSKSDRQREMEELQREEMEKSKSQIRKVREPLIVQVTDENGNPINQVCASAPKPRINL